MKLFVKICLILLSVLIGLSFVYSSYTKAWPIERFEYRIVEYVQLPWLLSAIAARSLVGLEAALGVLIALNIFGKSKWVLKFSMLILVVFSIYLVYLWVAVGNDVNCGCFGDDILMTPSESLIKNGVMLLLIFILDKWHKGLTKRWLHAFTIFGCIVGMAVPFIAQPIPSSKPGFLEDKAFEVNLEVLYEDDIEHKPAYNLAEGKHIIVFMSLTCPHCREAAYKVYLMKKRNPDLPFYFILNGDENYLESFWEDTKAKDVPYTMLGAKKFVKLAGDRVPVVYWVNNSTVEAQPKYIDMTQTGIEDWLKK